MKEDARMTSSPDSEFDSRLLDLHLGRLSAHERTALEQRIQSDPALRAQSEALAIMFEALNSVREAEPELPAGLTEKICARVASAGPPPRVIRPARKAADELAQSEGPRVIRLHSFREIMAIAAVIVLAIGLGVPSLFQMRARGQRIACSEQLAQIGRGMQAYAMANHDSLPFAGWSRNSSWRPTDEPGLSVLPNRRHVYPLLRAGHLPARIFVCPSASGLPMPDDQIPYHDDFLESRNVSYAYQNMAGVRPSLRDNPNVPIFGDDNPFFDNGWPLIAVARSLGLSDPAKANSRAHGGAGQNILTIRGNVKWLTTPNAGINGDNIWTLQGVTEYTGREGPRSSTDSHLLK
jgi:hypothetical protein